MHAQTASAFPQSWQLHARRCAALNRRPLATPGSRWVGWAHCSTRVGTGRVVGRGALCNGAHLNTGQPLCRCAVEDGFSLVMRGLALHCLPV